MSIMLFDSLSHPTLTGAWAARGGCDATFSTLTAALARSGFSRACAVGLHGVEGYEHQAYYDACTTQPSLVPVAGIRPDMTDVGLELDRVRDIGYRAIKIHPRLARLDLGGPALGKVMLEAAKRDLVVFLCTYYHDTIERYPRTDPLYDIVAAVKQAPHVRLVLLHGGDVELLRYVQFARHSPNILIDLSHTILKYRGSSLDNDIEYLVKHFNRRTCLGVDHPEFDHEALRLRFEELASHVNRAEAENIGFRNLQAFLSLPEA